MDNLSSYQLNTPITVFRSLSAIKDHISYQILNNTQLSSRYIIAVAGIPGSGKTTLCNRIVESFPNSCQIISLDGFHFYRNELDQFKDPISAHLYRGSPWTFNLSKFSVFLSQLSYSNLHFSTFLAPSFDHSIKDPIENNINILPKHKLLLIEGNYLLLNNEGWKDIRQYFNETWFISCNMDKSMERVAKRHLEAGICTSMESAKKRIESNDRPNGHLIISNTSRYDYLIESDKIFDSIL